MYRAECDQLARILSQFHTMNPDNVYGPFHMKEFIGIGTAYECGLEVATPGAPLCRAIERTHIGDDDDMNARVLIFPLSAHEAGKLVHIKLVNILCCGDVTHEWPKDKIVISSHRYTDDVLVATEEREVSGVEHAISSVYIRGVERISIMCKFFGDVHPKYTIVIVEFRLCQDAGVRVITAAGSGGGGGSGSGGGGGSGSGGGGGSGSRGGGGSGSRGGGGRLMNDDDGDEGSVAAGSRRSSKFPRPSDGGSAGLFSSTQDRHLLAGPNSEYAIPDQEEMMQLLAAQAASASAKQSLGRDTSVVLLPCVVCKEESKKKQCVICKVKETRIIFQPCYHIVCCEDCGNLEQIVNCPVCRAPIQQRMMVYGDRFD